MTFLFCVCVSDLCIRLMHAATHSVKPPAPLLTFSRVCVFNRLLIRSSRAGIGAHTHVYESHALHAPVFRAHVRVHCPLTSARVHNTCAGIIRTNTNLLASHQQLIYSGMLLASNTNARAPLMLNTDAVTVRVLSQPAHPGLSEAA